MVALPCVRKARGDDRSDGGSSSGDGDGDGSGKDCPAEGFVAFTFPDDAALCAMPTCVAARGADSDSKAGRGSAVLLGDTGVRLAGLDDGDSEVADGAADRESSMLPQQDQSLPAPVEAAVLLSESAAAAHAAVALCNELCGRSYALLRVASAEVAALRAAEAEALSFFTQSADEKAVYVSEGGRSGDLLLWSCGYTRWPHREQFHVVCGVPDAQPWPCDFRRTQHQGGAGGGFRASMLAAESILRNLAFECLRGLELDDLLDQCTKMGTGYVHR